MREKIMLRFCRKRTHGLFGAGRSLSPNGANWYERVGVNDHSSPVTLVGLTICLPSTTGEAVCVGCTDVVVGVVGLGSESVLCRASLHGHRHQQRHYRRRDNWSRWRTRVLRPARRIPDRITDNGDMFHGPFRIWRARRRTCWEHAWGE